MKFYADAEEILSKVPRRGVSMILREVSEGKSKPFGYSSMQHIVQRFDRAVVQLKQINRSNMYQSHALKPHREREAQLVQAEETADL